LTAAAGVGAVVEGVAAVAGVAFTGTPAACWPVAWAGAEPVGAGVLAAAFVLFSTAEFFWLAGCAVCVLAVAVAAGAALVPGACWADATVAIRASIEGISAVFSAFIWGLQG